RLVGRRGRRAVDGERRGRRATLRHGDGLRRPAAHGAVRGEPAQGHRVAAGRETVEGRAAIRVDVLTPPARSAHGDGVAVGVGRPTRGTRGDGQTAGDRRAGDGERGRRAAGGHAHGAGVLAAHGAVAGYARELDRVTRRREPAVVGGGVVCE